MLHLIFNDLAERVIEKAITLENFVLFFHKNGFWGERLFREFDVTETNHIIEKEFIIGMGMFFMIQPSFSRQTNNKRSNFCIKNFQIAIEK